MKKRITSFIIYFVCTVFTLSNFCSCEKTEYTDVWEDRYIDQKVDTTEIKENWYLTDHISRTATDLGSGKELSTISLYADDKELYVANEKGSSVDVFDLKTMEYKRSLNNGNRTTAHDVYVEGNHVFVAAGNMREVQIFDKTSGKYLTRLGTGSFTGNVSWAGCVAANNRFVFVRDSKERNIRVFDRNEISTDKTDNNTVFARLNTESHFIGSATEPTADSFDMEIIGDSLYAFLHRPGLIYTYSIHDVETLKDNTPFVKTPLPSGMKIYSVSKDVKRNSVWVSMYMDGKTLLAEISMKDFLNRKFNSPLRSFTSNEKHVFSTQPIIAYDNETLTFTAGTSIERWSIINIPSYIIKPL